MVLGVLSEEKNSATVPFIPMCSRSRMSPQRSATSQSVEPLDTTEPLHGMTSDSPQIERVPADPRLKKG